MSVRLAQSGLVLMDGAAALTREVLRTYGPISLEVEGGDVNIALTNSDEIAADPDSPRWKTLPTPLAAGGLHGVCYESNYVRVEAASAGVSVFVGVPGPPGRLS